MFFFNFIPALQTNVAMKFKITLNFDEQVLVSTILINWQYELSALVYGIFQESINYAAWLHGDELPVNNKLFQFFPYSKFYIPCYVTDKDKFFNSYKEKSNYINIKYL